MAHCALSAHAKSNRLGLGGSGTMTSGAICYSVPAVSLAAMYVLSSRYFSCMVSAQREDQAEEQLSLAVGCGLLSGNGGGGGCALTVRAQDALHCAGCALYQDRAELSCNTTGPKRMSSSRCCLVLFSCMRPPPTVLYCTPASSVARAHVGGKSSV